jgi:polysaccharide biosynthesis transport protein
VAYVRARGILMAVDREFNDAKLGHYLKVVRRRKWVIVQAMVLVPLVAVIYSLSQLTMYQATSEVLLSRQNFANSLTGTVDPNAGAQADRVAETQARLATVPEVARRTLRAAGLDRPAADLLSHSSVAAEANADLLRISVTDHEPRLAIQLATDYARQFTRYREELDTASVARARAGVDAKIKQLEAAKRTKGALYSNLVNRSQQLATMQALQTSNAIVVRTPTSATQTQPKVVRSGLTGLVLGLLFGLGLAFLWDALDTRVRSGDEIEDRLGMPLLARLGEPARKLSRAQRLVMLADPNSPQAEAFQMLRANIDFAGLGREIRSIMITSCVDEEGKSTTSANLAVALARNGARVALVDLDLRRPSLAGFFDLPRDTPGLTQVVIGNVDLEETLVPISLYEAFGKDGGRQRDSRAHPGATPNGSLHLLTAGPIPPNPGEFIGSTAVAHILLQLRSQFDRVVIDTAPALRVADAMTLSSRVDAVAAVTRMNVVRRPMLNELRRLLDSAPATKLGFIVTGVTDEVGYGVGYGYGYAVERGFAAVE